MPRVYLQRYSQDDVEPNYPFDVCENCWPIDAYEAESRAKVSLEDVEASIDDAGPDGHNHPPYSECDYECEICEEVLTDLDN